jgi:NAD(P)H-dependent FMN reductase
MRRNSHAGAPTVQVILGSVRAGRLCPRIAAWVIEIGRATTELNYELADLADWHLPVVDEPGIPAYGGYTQEHTSDRGPQDAPSGDDAGHHAHP